MDVELLQCRVDGIEVLEGTTFYEMLTGKLIVEKINPSWLIFSDGFQKSALRKFFKRSIDLLLALVITFLLLSALFALVALVFNANQVATGLALTIVGVGLSSFVGAAWVGKPLAGFEPLALPRTSRRSSASSRRPAARSWGVRAFAPS